MAINRFGRIPAPDPNDKKYPMRAALAPRPVPRYKNWMTGKRMPLNQGDTGTCVAHAWVGFLLAAPLMCRNPPSPYDAYRGLILLDEFNDNDYEATLPDSELQYGSSIRGGAQYFRQTGHVKSFVWATNLEELLMWLLTKGPVVMGTNWYWDMSTPDPDTGIINLGGGLAGGHAYLLIGANKDTKLVTGINSWDRDWGIKGRFRIRFADLERLAFAEEGEACAATEQKVVPVAA